MPITKTIHVIWIGKDTIRPDALIETWRRMNPTFNLRVWGNADLIHAKWQLMPQIEAWINQEINGAADIMRWEILYRHGGLAVDADSICVRPLEDWLLEPDCFAAWENEIARPGLIGCNALASIPGHPLIGQILHDIVNDAELLRGRAWAKVGPARITDTVRNHHYTGLTIYPSHYFAPQHHSGLRYVGSGPVFACQEWGSTFRSYAQLAQKRPEDLALNGNIDQKYLERICK